MAKVAAEFKHPVRSFEMASAKSEPIKAGMPCCVDPQKVCHRQVKP